MGYQYGVYKGDEFIMVGSLEEVAKKLGVSEKSVKWMASPTAKRRADKPGSTKMIVVKVEVD